MSGKPYTMKEMKAIVDYLTEHKAYGEIRARKMWMDLQDSKITDRTWQSLKETFLKRILPDIHNPYYKLSVQQISSFQKGHDLETKINNKLQISRTGTPDSNTDGEQQKNKEDSDMKKNKEKTDEDLSKSKSHLRASTETLILENIEEPEDQKKNRNASKHSRDLNSFSNPLKSMLQGLMNDLGSYAEDDGSNDEPRMQIVEATDEIETTTSEANIIVLDGSNSDDAHEVADMKSFKSPKETLSPYKMKSKNDVSDAPDHRNINEKNVSTQLLNETEVSSNIDKDVTDISSGDPKNSESPVIVNQNRSISKTQNSKTVSKLNLHSSASITDTFLPDNQEALKEKTLTSYEGVKTYVNKSKTVCGKRRAISECKEGSKKRMLSNDKQPTTDIETYTKKKEKVDLKKRIKAKYNKKKVGEGSLLNAQTNNEEVQDLIHDEENELNYEPTSKDVNLSQNKYSKNSDVNQIEVEGKTEADNSEVRNITVNNDNEVEVLKSHSDPLSNSAKETKKSVNNRSKQQHRDRALANTFGFTSGAVNRDRRRRFKNSRKSHHTVNISSDSSDWTSDTGSEYISPPRGRKSKQTRKYLKPESARVLSLKEEGGLLVYHAKKIYPVVKDGKIIKNFVNFISEDDNDTEESYWKLKYVEEKKKTEELTKLIKQEQEKSDQHSRKSAAPSTSLNIAPEVCPRKTEPNLPPTELIPPDNISPVNQKDENSTKAVPNKDLFKIKFTIKNEEVQVEGSSTLAKPLLEQVVQLLQTDSSPNATNEKSCRESVSVNSRKSSILVNSDQEARERIDKLESDIFKEIVEIEKDDSVPDEKITTPNKELTKSKGRSSKIPKLDEPTESESNVSESKPVPTRRSARTPNKAPTGSNEGNENNAPRTRNSTAKLSTGKQTNKDISEVKYKFPTLQTTKNKKKEVKNQKQRKSNRLCYNNRTSSDDISIDSTQGYVDSDFSPINLPIRKRRRTSFTVLTYRTKRQTRTQKSSHPYLTDDITGESSSSYQGSTKSITFHNSTLTSDIYKSESYQLLMNNNVSVRNKQKSFQKLEKINEASAVNEKLCTEALFNIDGNDTQPKDIICQTNTDSSSNVTLPPSPVLSIVENISINKSILSSVDDLVFENKVPFKDATEKVVLNEFMKSDVDVSMPLLEQDCQSGKHEGFEYHYNLNVPKTADVSESFLNKINTVNLGDPTLSESINVKLSDLVLESNKKKPKGNNTKHNKDENITHVQSKPVTKNKHKKRSSTPRKRRNIHESKTISIEPCIEEEHMETCSQLSRKSCPPETLWFKEIGNYEDNDSVTVIESNTDKPNGRRKKDVIKVKITKPKRQSKESKDSLKSICNSVQTDSGINDINSSIFLNTNNDSVDLIHNHSDTCLNAYECLGSSVEIVKSSTNSTITLDSDCTSQNEDNYYRKMPEVMAQELFCNNAQDGSKLCREMVTELKEKSGSATVDHIPLATVPSSDSLITDDLSDEPSPQPAVSTKWYLYTDDETTSAFYVNSKQETSCGANLNQLFPITCAVPDLSTITEMSKENEEFTRKFSDDISTRSDLDL